MKRFELQGEQIEVLTDACNAWIVRTPGRKFPGMVTQGDSLRNLYDLVRRQCDLLRGSKEEEAYDLALQLEDDLANRLVIYEEALASHGLPLPYPNSVKNVRIDQKVSD